MPCTIPDSVTCLDLGNYSGQIQSEIIPHNLKSLSLKYLNIIQCYLPIKNYILIMILMIVLEMMFNN